jgi:hypothetical protein
MAVTTEVNGNVILSENGLLTPSNFVLGLIDAGPCSLDVIVSHSEIDR